MFEALGWLGLMSREAMGRVGGTVHQAMLDHGRTAVRDTPAFVWLVSPAGSRRQQIAAGRACVRCQLAATGLGLAMQPVSQALQEYDGAPPSPRWSLESRLKPGLMARQAGWVSGLAIEQLPVEPSGQRMPAPWHINC